MTLSGAKFATAWFEHRWADGEGCVLAIFSRFMCSCGNPFCYKSEQFFPNGFGRAGFCGKFIFDEILSEQGPANITHF